MVGPACEAGLWLPVHRQGSARRRKNLRPRIAGSAQPGTVGLVSIPSNEAAPPASVTAGRTLLEAVVGSTAHGLTVAGSDIDLLAVHLAPTRQVLGLDGPRLVTQSFATIAPDRTSHELGKFVALALAANPTILEALYADEYRICTPEGARLVAARSSLLSTRAVRSAYGGYARSQLDRLLRRGDGSFSSDTRQRVEKHARHCRRLLLQGTELLSTGTLTLDVSAHRELLFAAGRLAVTHPERFVEEFTAALLEFDAVPSILAEQPDVRAVEQLVTAIRIDDLLPGA